MFSRASAPFSAVSRPPEHSQARPQHAARSSAIALELRKLVIASDVRLLEHEGKGRDRAAVRYRPTQDRGDPA